MYFGKIYYFLILLPLAHLFLYQIRVNLNEPQSCLKVFKSNNFFGFIIFLNIFLTKIF